MLTYKKVSDIWAPKVHTKHLIEHRYNKRRMDDELEKIRQQKLKEMMDSMNSPQLPDTPIEMSDQNIDTAINDYSRLVVDCWAVWCGPCTMVAPTIEALAKEKSQKVVFGKLDIDHNHQTAMKYSISAVPTILVFKDGQLKGKILGALPKSQLDNKITELLQ